MSRRSEIFEDYDQAAMPLDVMREYLGPLTDDSDSLFEFYEPPMEIADYLSHYFSPA